MRGTVEMSSFFIVWTTDETSGVLSVWSKHSWRHPGQRKFPDLSNHSLIHDSWYSEGKNLILIQLIENMIQWSKQRYNRCKFFIFCVQVSSIFNNTYTLTSPVKLMSTRYHAMSEWNCNSTNIYLKRILQFHSKKYI